MVHVEFTVFTRESIRNSYQNFSVVRIAQTVQRSGLGRHDCSQIFRNGFVDEIDFARSRHFADEAEI